MNLPSVVSAYTPHAYSVNRLCVKCRQTFWVNQFQSSIVQIHEKVLALEKATSAFDEMLQDENLILAVRAVCTRFRRNTGFLLWRSN